QRLITSNHEPENKNKIKVLRPQLGGQICRENRKIRENHGSSGNRANPVAHAQKDFYRLALAAREQKSARTVPVELLQKVARHLQLVFQNHRRIDEIGIAQWGRGGDQSLILNSEL